MHFTYMNLTDHEAYEILYKSLNNNDHPVSGTRQFDFGYGCIG